MSYMDRLTIRIPARLRRDLDKLSRDRQLPVSALVREALGRSLAQERCRALRKKTVPFAQAQGFLTDDDVFKAVS